MRINRACMHDNMSAFSTLGYVPPHIHTHTHTQRPLPPSLATLSIGSVLAAPACDTREGGKASGRREELTDASRRKGMA